ncbi:MAG TPA: hypothetical protein QGF58_30235 [Myxococcota bacterium]|nr:hypothetical protein [Myxococcota bacterium]
MIWLLFACTGGEADFDDSDRSLYWYTAPEPPSCCACSCSSGTVEVTCNPDCGDCDSTCDDACPDEGLGDYLEEFEEC